MTRTLLVLLALLLVAPAAAQARAGQPDRSFAIGGTQTLNARGADAVGGAILALPNGRLLAGGAVGGKLVVLRLHSTSGKLDNAFGDHGQFIPDLPGTSLDGVRALATFRDGRIVAAATMAVDGVPRMVAIRVLPNGEIDPSFGGGLGYVVAGPAGAQLGSMAMDTNGNIVLVGARPAADEVPLVIRLAPDGTPDTTFGAGGSVDGVPLGLSGRATSVLARPDGTVIFTVGAAPSHVGSPAFTVVRLLTTGAPDPGFGGTGIVTVPFGAGTGEGLGADALNLGPSGTLLVAGTDLSSGGTQRVAIVRLHANGTLDKRFGTRGLARVARAGRNLSVTSMARDSAGRILIAGTSRAPGALVVRLRSNGDRDKHFGTRGVTFPRLGRPAGGSPVFTTFAGVDAVGTHAVLVGSAAGPGALIRGTASTAYLGHFALTVSRLR